MGSGGRGSLQCEYFVGCQASPPTPIRQRFPKGQIRHGLAHAPVKHVVPHPPYRHLCDGDDPTDWHAASIHRSRGRAPVPSQDERRVHGDRRQLRRPHRQL